MEDYCIVAFRQTGDAMKAHKILCEQQLSPFIMPTPRSVSVSCGISVRFRPQDLKAVFSALREQFPESGRCLFYRADVEQGRRVFNLILQPDSSYESL